MRASFAIALKIAAAIVFSLVVAITSVAQTFVVSATTATGIGLASAAQFQVLTDAQWPAYENAITIAALNETTRLAVNSGRPLSSAGYSSFASAVRAQLDANAPSAERQLRQIHRHGIAVDAALFQRMDIAGRLRFGIDSLTPLASSLQAGSGRAALDESQAAQPGRGKLRRS